jgi:hypothetical protein
VTQLDQDDRMEDRPEGGLNDAPKDGLEDGSEDGTEDRSAYGSNGGPQSGQNDEIGVIQQLFLREKLLQIIGLTITEKMEALTAQQYEFVNNAAQSFFTILQ